jgi:transposase
MPQSLLPLIPDGATPINDLVSVVRENGEWTYFLGVLPVFSHAEEDRRSFRMFTAQLVCQATCRQADIVRAFGVSGNSVKRSVKKYRTEGIEGFYRPRPGRGPTVLREPIAAEVQQRLDRGEPRHEIATQLGIKVDTIRKAIQQGRLTEPSRDQKAASPPVASDKSARGVEDTAAADGLGMACTRVLERTSAALGLLPGGAPTRFEPCHDVSFGGVLCALPALTQNGLFRHLEQCFPSLGGYYTTLQVLSLLGYLALCRIRTVEQLQYHPPGELGKLLGLDRVPEVRCLRNKLASLSADDAPQTWAALLSHDWLEAEPDLAGALYVDGHVRLYHGQKTELPRRYVARQKLCLRGTTDYWVNDALGQPFFLVERPINHGILEALRSDIVPRLLADVPRQPTQEELDRDRYRHRFVIIFDREGYSPEFFREMWTTHRIACITYHKYPKESWPEDEFSDTPVTLPNGETVSLKLAERGSWIGEKKKGLWVREVRKLTTGGHQTSLISSAYGQTALADAAGLFSRWSQENFFRYAMQHFAIDLLSEYGTEKISDTKQPVVNPARRELDRQRRSLQSKLTRARACYAALTMHPKTDTAEVPSWERRKAVLFEQIEPLEHELDAVKERQKETPSHLPWKELPEASQFERLAPGRKRLLDTVKMIAYRAETAMVSIVREVLKRVDDARALVRDLFSSDADLIPNEAQQKLEVRVHPHSNPRLNRAIAHLLEQLNAMEMVHPGTKLQLVYTMVGPPPECSSAPPELESRPSDFPPDQDV